MPNIEESRMDRRPKGATVTLLALDEASLLERLNAKVPQAEYAKGVRYVACTPETLAYGTDGEHHWTIGTEGVGWDFDPGPLQVEFQSTSWVDANGERQTSMGGGAIVEFTPEEAHAIVAASTETVELAEFIRTFGDRLDNNHALWFGRLTKGA